MPDTTTFEKVQEICVEQLGVYGQEVKPESRFYDDLGCDSLDVVELVMFFEDEFEIEIKDEETEKIQTVQQAVELVDRLVAQKGAQ